MSPVVRCGVSSIVALVCAMAPGATAGAQAPVITRRNTPATSRAISRAEAVALALSSSTRHTLARSDVASATAQLSAARQYENPALTTSYSSAAPQAHVTLDVPIDWPGLRAPRIAAARAQLGAATVRLTLADVLLAFDTDTAYTRAQALAAQADLLAATARDADSLLVLARVRRDAGDASDLDVEIATLSAGQLANAASVAFTSTATALLRLQRIMGVSTDSVQFVLADTMGFTAPTPVAPPDVTTGVPLTVAAADLDVRAAEALARLERRRSAGAPSLTLGVEAVNPGGPGGPLPLVGVSLPLPLFNRNRAAIARADADLVRGRTQLRQAQLEQQFDVRLAQTEALAARRRAEQSLRLLASAERVGALSLLAYREGATTLVSVIEAQRVAREARAQWLEDLAAVQIAERVQQLLSFRLSTTP
ncbi:TolC family protein [Gemmatimonas groenlandica]|uniref:TolC family protein n=1 Tax=Gemmatimonas groenlandica TaxID=2732249 RepID=A0A6M4IP75_9BACT|nr:TolC family protein [Gemmatimonas groenlandica]QJR35748.1 TolC family protein [Gemmatimonas groenlandica]